MKREPASQQARSLIVPQDVYDLAFDIADMTGEDTAGLCYDILREHLSKKKAKLERQKTCDHSLKHHHKGDWWCQKCSLPLPDYVCPCEDIRETAQWGNFCGDCGKAIED
jgi:hypothetical protein